MSKLVSIKNEKDSCPKCGNQNFNVIVFSDTVDFRSMELDVENLEESKCGNCGYKWESKKQRIHNESIIRASYAVMRDKMREKHGLLPGNKIAEIREKFALSQREAAALFGGGYNAFNKYESGEVLQSYAMDRLLRLTDAIGKPAVDFLKDVFTQPNFKVTTSSKDESSVVVVIIGHESSSCSKIELSGTSKLCEFHQKPYPKLASDASSESQKRFLLN